MWVVLCKMLIVMLRQNSTVRGKEKLHLDQSLSDPSFQCVQSWVTVWDVHPGDATLTLLEGNNSLFESFSNAFNLTSAKKDWRQHTEDQIQWFKDRGCVVRDITCEAGSHGLLGQSYRAFG